MSLDDLPQSAPRRHVLGWMRRGERNFFGGFAVLVVLVMIAGIFTGLRSCAVERTCAQNGYPQFKIDAGGFGTGYCIKRVDQSDVIVPVEKVQRW